MGEADFEDPLRSSQTRTINAALRRSGHGACPFDHALPGESGTRNPLRGDGYFSWDGGLDKEFKITEKTKVQLRWEMFNLTNSVRFDSHSISSTLDNAGNFGQATVLLTNKRLAQFSARIEF
jgi:hypothetical protein